MKTELTFDDKDFFIENLINDSEGIEDALTSIHGLDTWFESFVLSPEFQELDRSAQKESFERYKNLQNALSYIDSFFGKHKLGIYQNSH